jgi:hypothetical protein
MLFYVAYMPFEFVVGIWLLAKGPPVQPTATGGALSALTGHSEGILAQPSMACFRSDRPSSAPLKPLDSGEVRVNGVC